MKILKTSDKHQTISFAILTPDEVDRNGDKIKEDEIIKTAHEFGQCMCKKFLNIDHKDGTELDKEDYAFVENFVLPFDMDFGDETVKKWTWYVGIKFFNKKVYEDIKKGEYVGVSMQGYMLASE